MGDTGGSVGSPWTWKTQEPQCQSWASKPKAHCGGLPHFTSPKACLTCGSEIQVSHTVIASSPKPQKLLPNLFKCQWLRLPANAGQPDSFWEVGSFGVMVLEQNVPCHSTLCRDNKTNPKKSSIHILGLTLQTPTSDVCKGLLSPAKPDKSKTQNHQ